MRGEGAGPPFPTFCTTRSTEPFGAALSQDPPSWSGKTGHPLGSCTGLPSWLSSNLPPQHSSCTLPLWAVQTQVRSSESSPSRIGEHKRTNAGKICGAQGAHSERSGDEGGTWRGKYRRSLRGQGQDHSHSVIITWQCLPGTSYAPGAVQLQQRRGEPVLELPAPGERAASEPTSHSLHREACQLKKMHNVLFRAT